MSWLGNIIKSVGDVAGDLVKTALVVPNASFKSITGKDLVNIDYKTDVGKTVGGLNKLGIDTVHTAAQTFANTVTGGYASKLHEKLVPGIVQSQKIEQNEKIFSGGVLGKFEDLAKKGAPIVGSIGTGLLKKGAGGVTTAATETLKKNDMSLLSSITSGFNKVADAAVKFSNTGVGQAATGVLAGYLGNLANSAIKNTGISPQLVQAQAVALQTGNVNTSSLSGLQEAALNGKGLTVDIPLPGETWWSKNKGWAIPVITSVSGVVVVFLFVALFKKRR